MKKNKAKKDINRILDEKNLRSSDLIENTGMTYRQINDWQNKGLLPDERKSNKKWRTFTSKEVFIMMVCKEIRDKFGVPLESLNFIRKFMLQEQADHFKYVLEMCEYGFAVVLLTDLEETFIIESDMEIGNLLRIGLLRGNDTKNYMLIKLSPLINRMLKMKDLPELNVNDELYQSIFDAIKDSNLNSNVSDNEKEILELIRNECFKKVTVHLKDGNVFLVDTEEELSDQINRENNQYLLEILESNEFQSLTIHKQDDKIVRLNRKIPRKINKKKK